MCKDVVYKVVSALSHLYVGVEQGGFDELHNGDGCAKHGELQKEVGQLDDGLGSC